MIRSWLVCRSWVVGRSFVNWITWSSFVCYFSNVARITISSIVFNDLSSAIWKNYSIFTRSRVSITGFVLSKVNSSILISYSVLVLVNGRFSIGGFFVSWLVGGSGVVYWFVDGGSMVNWSWCVGRSVVDGGSMVNWGWFVGLVGWCMINSMTVAIGVTVFHGSVAGHSSIGNSQEGNKSNKRLQRNNKSIYSQDVFLLQFQFL
jgi:hypothetical protein